MLDASPFAPRQKPHNANESNQTIQKSATRQLHDINEILSKSKGAFLQGPKEQNQKVFPEDPPPQPPAPADDPILLTQKATPKVTLSRLSVEDQKLMQRSLTEFAEKSPDLAKKLGVIKDEEDAFSVMKAEGE